MILVVTSQGCKSLGREGGKKLAQATDQDIKRGVTSSVCRLITTRLDLLHSREEGNSQGSLNHVFLG
jgi:hypothetical protein